MTLWYFLLTTSTASKKKRNVVVFKRTHPFKGLLIYISNIVFY